MNKLFIIIGLAVVAVLWILVMSLISSTGDAGPGESLPSSDGSKMVIKQVETNRFAVNKEGEITLRLDLTDGSGKPIPNLKPEDFKVYEENVPGIIRGYNGPATESINMILVIDTSGSMTGRTEKGTLKMDDAKAAAQVALDGLKVGRDRIGVISFSHTFTTIFPFQDLTDTSKPICQTAIDRMFPNGGTNIGSPTEEALRMLEEADPRGPRFIMVMTDGEDGGLGRRIPGLGVKSKAIVTPIYTIGFGRGVGGGRLLRDLAAACNGEHHHAPDRETLTKIYQSRIKEVADKSSIVYQSPYRDADGLPRRVRLELTLPGGKVTATNNYQIGPLIPGASRGDPVLPPNEKTTVNVGGPSTLFQILLFLGLLALLGTALMIPSLRGGPRSTGGPTMVAAPAPVSGSVGQGFVVKKAPPPPPGRGVKKGPVPTATAVKPATPGGAPPAAVPVPPPATGNQSSPPPAARPAAGPVPPPPPKPAPKPASQQPPPAQGPGGKKSIRPVPPPPPPPPPGKKT